MKQIPDIVQRCAQSLIKEWGGGVEYLGRWDDHDAYHYVYPDDVDAGYPVVYLFDGDTAEEVPSFVAMDILRALVKD